jgi:hypothetical protein
VRLSSAASRRGIRMPNSNCLGPRWHPIV